MIKVTINARSSNEANSIYSQLDENYGDDPDDIRYDEQEDATLDTLDEFPEMKEIYEDNGFGSLSDFLADDFWEIDITEEQKKKFL